jgi:hypothetical protein
MATVPTAATLNLGQNVQTTADTTPTDGPSAELAGAASRIAQAQQKMVTDTGLKLSSDFAAAQNKINIRTDNINRTREFNSYFQGMSKEFQNLMDGDVANPAALEAFSFKLQTETERVLNDHKGSPESRNKLAIRLENQRAGFSSGAKSAVDTAQQAIVDKQFSEDISGIVSGIATGKISLAEGLIEVDKFGEEYSEVGSDTSTFDKVEAAQQMVILGSIQRLVDLGNSDEAEAMINSNPEVIQTLPPEAVQKMVRSIELQKIQKSKLIAEKQLKQENILKGYGVDSPKDLPPAIRMLYYTGQMGTSAKDERTPEMKNAEALAKLELQYGKDSSQYKNLAQLVQKQETIPKTEIEKQFDRLKFLKANDPDSQEARVIENQINLSDPEFMKNKKKQEDFPAAQDTILELERTTKQVTTAIDDALILISGVDDTGDRQETIDNALKAISLGETGDSATGNIGLIMSYLSGTSAGAQLKATLTPVTSNIVLQTMSKMRDQSSSGATGLGSMNNEERKMLENAAGSLDTRNPVQLIKTLLSMRDSFPAVLKRQQEKFSKGFASILGVEPETPNSDNVEDPKTPRGQEDGQKPGMINLLTYGDGENEPPQLPTTVTPAAPTTVTPTTVTPAPTTVTPTIKSPEVTGKKNVVPKVKSNVIMDKYNETEKRVSKVLKKYNIKKIPIDLDFMLIDLERFADLDDTKGFNKQVDKIKGNLEEIINNSRNKK